MEHLGLIGMGSLVSSEFCCEFLVTVVKVKVLFRFCVLRHVRKIEKSDY